MVPSSWFCPPFYRNVQATMSIAEAQDPLWVSMEGLVWQHSRATFTVDHCWSNVWTRYRWSRSSVSGQWLWVKIEDSWTPQNGWASLNILNPIPGQTILTQSHGKDVHVYRMFRCKLMWHLRRVSLRKQLRSWKSYISIWTFAWIHFLVQLNCTIYS